MRFLLESIAAACCVSAVFFSTVSAQDSPAPADAQCKDKPELTDVTAALARLDYMAGLETGKVSDDVMMIDFTVSVRNAGAVGAGRTRLKYSVDIRAPGGAGVQSMEDTMDIYSVRAGATEENLVTIMVSALGPLLQPDGTVAGTAILRVEVDVDNEVAECNEADNRAEVETPFSTEKVVG
ncbi:MAG: CARDB domain-containing protein [Pseudomonadota bacterium]|nr:CARDB domain-containing protein [Pseudomonadota bacterium]